MTRDDAHQEEASARQQAFSRALARAMALVGVLTVVVVAAVLAVGAWLEHQFNLGPLVTILLLIGSIPVVTVIVFVVVRRVARELTPLPAHDLTHNNED